MQSEMFEQLPLDQIANLEDLCLQNGLNISAMEEALKRIPVVEGRKPLCLEDVASPNGTRPMVLHEILDYLNRQETLPIWFNKLKEMGYVFANNWQEALKL